ncbi:hypothetical protein [Nonomuraea glycinis]|uniref:hypothetical protein n=1 Tax=Nonomuraea glycinis TaxID=2047744 RepID=UPI002E104786|nr:hypothetical protein OHA68_11555 [Nonomuraea glycinis]
MRVALAGAMTVVAMGMAATPASANDYRDYKIVLSQQLSAIVNICLKAESYDEGNRDYRESCTGKVPSPSKHELTVQITDRHRVWLNVNVLAGESADQITLHNGYSNTLQRHVFEVHWCAPVGTLYIWQLECISDSIGRKEIFHWQ